MRGHCAYCGRLGDLKDGICEFCPTNLEMTIARGIAGKLAVNNEQGASDWLDGFVAALRFYNIPSSGVRITQHTEARIREIAKRIQQDPQPHIPRQLHPSRDHFTESDGP